MISYLGQLYVWVFASSMTLRCQFLSRHWIFSLLSQAYKIGVFLPLNFTCLRQTGVELIQWIKTTHKGIHTCKPWKKIGVLLKGQGSLKPIYKNVNPPLIKCQHLPHIWPFVINVSFPFPCGMACIGPRNQTSLLVCSCGCCWKIPQQQYQLLAQDLNSGKQIASCIEVGG